jgi:hypothetical protein
VSRPNGRGGGFPKWIKIRLAILRDDGFLVRSFEHSPETSMKSYITALALASIAFAATATAETYQATGPVVEVTDSKIIIQKSKTTKWEFARNSSTKVKGDLKVGSTVTIYYNMTAVSTEEKVAGTEETKSGKASKKSETPEKPMTTRKKAS